MKDAFLVLWSALKDSWDALFLLMFLNVITLLLTIPILTAAPAFAALWYAGNRVARGRTVSIPEYFAAFRFYFWKAWVLTVINILGFAIAFVNLWFFVTSDALFETGTALSLAIAAFWLAMGFLWLVFQMYPLALLMEQEDQRLRTALRNAAVLLIANPGFSVLLALLLLSLAVFIGLVLLPLWFIILWAFFAVACNKAVLHLLKPHRRKAERTLAED
jgi:hypothetical protein